MFLFLYAFALMIGAGFSIFIWQAPKPRKESRIKWERDHTAPDVGTEAPALEPSSTPVPMESSQH